MHCEPCEPVGTVSPGPCRAFFVFVWGLAAGAQKQDGLNRCAKVRNVLKRSEQKYQQKASRAALQGSNKACKAQSRLKPARLWGSFELSRPSRPGPCMASRLPTPQQLFWATWVRLHSDSGHWHHRHWYWGLGCLGPRLHINAL